MYDHKIQSEESQQKKRGFEEEWIGVLEAVGVAKEIKEYDDVISLSEVDK